MYSYSATVTTNEVAAVSRYFASIGDQEERDDYDDRLMQDVEGQHRLIRSPDEIVCEVEQLVAESRDC